MSNREWEFLDDGAIGQTLSDMADDTPIFQAAAADHNHRVLYPDKAARPATGFPPTRLRKGKVG